MYVCMCVSAVMEDHCNTLIGCLWSFAHLHLKTSCIPVQEY